jgi:hypothetical protein
LVGRCIGVVAALVGATGAIGAPAVNTEANRVSTVRVLAGDWNYVPIVTHKPGGHEINTIVAFSKPGTTVGNNLVAVRYNRVGTGWEKETWTEIDQWKIVTTLKDELGIPSDDDFRWGVGPTEGEGSASASVPMEGGLLEEDPLAPVVASTPDPIGTTQVLVAMGYAAAMPPSEGVACGVSDLVGVIATSVHAESVDEDASTLLTAQGINAAVGSGCAASVITPILTRPIAPPSPWTTPDCNPLQLGGCQWVMRCHVTRTQSFIQRRTVTCVIGTTPVTCTQSTVIDCSETISCNGPSAPGNIDGAGRCLQPRTLPAIPATPCGTIAPNIPPSGPRLPPFDTSIPGNCSSLGGWVPPCACP